MKLILHFINPFRWFRAYRFKRKLAKFDKASYDLELYLYGNILKNDMLHYGYFEDVNIEPERISLQTIENAQFKYAQNILDKIDIQHQPILDVGCGMGGLAKMIADENLLVECLTPNKNQIEHINIKYPSMQTYHMKFEEFPEQKSYGTIINSESLQYINIDEAISKVNRLLNPDGKWIVVDYFRKQEVGNKSGHLLETFLQRLEKSNLKIVYQQDITQNILPTLSFINMYVDRFLLPLKHFAFEKLRYKMAMLYYMSNPLRARINRKIEHERKSINPQEFLLNKQYHFFVIERK